MFVVVCFADWEDDEDEEWRFSLIREFPFNFSSLISSIPFNLLLHRYEFGIIPLCLCYLLLLEVFFYSVMRVFEGLIFVCTLLRIWRVRWLELFEEFQRGVPKGFKDWRLQKLKLKFEILLHHFHCRLFLLVILLKVVRGLLEEVFTVSLHSVFMLVNLGYRKNEFSWRNKC